MSLLDKLWDDTVAGPRPETGLGKLRKTKTFSFYPNSESDGGSRRSYGEKSSEETKKVSRSIMIVKPRDAGHQNSSPPASPADSTSPLSPFSSREPFRLRRRSTFDKYEKANEVAQSQSREDK